MRRRYCARAGSAQVCRVDALSDEMDKAARQGAGLAGTRPRQGQLN
jgi:hypothetical protein